MLFPWGCVKVAQTNSKWVPFLAGSAGIWFESWRCDEGKILHENKYGKQAANNFRSFQGLLSSHLLTVRVHHRHWIRCCQAKLAGSLVYNDQLRGWRTCLQLQYPCEWSFDTRGLPSHLALNAAFGIASVLKVKTFEPAICHMQTNKQRDVNIRMELERFMRSL